MAAHAKLSPSGAGGWMRCPGWESNSESSAYAREGTAAHELGEKCLVNGTDASAYIGEIIVVEGESFEVDAEMAGFVQQYVDLARSIEGQRFIEVAVPIDHITGEADATGTSDTVVVCEDEIVVIDLKYGMGLRVEAPGNEQGQMYILGAMREFDYLGPFKRGRFIVSQPRLGHVSEAVFELGELTEFQGRAQHASKQHGTDTELVPSSKACRWCVKSATCEAARNAVLGTVADDFVDLDKPVAPQLSAAIERIESSDLNHLSQCLQSADFIEAWLKAVRARVERELFAGNTVPGYKLVQGKRGNRAWLDEAQADKALSAAKLKVADRYTKKLITPTQAAKLLKDSPLWAKVEQVITQSEGAPSVAPESDKRPALVMDAVAFSNLEV